MLSEKRHYEEEGTAAAWAILHMTGRADWPAMTAGRSRTAILRIKRRMWQHIEANRRATKGGAE